MPRDYTALPKIGSAIMYSPPLGGSHNNRILLTHLMLVSYKKTRKPQKKRLEVELVQTQKKKGGNHVSGVVTKHVTVKAVKAPVQKSFEMVQSTPFVQWHKTGKCTFTHTERVGVLTGSTTYFTQRYPVNIGDKNLFPLGSRMAALFTRYRFINLEFLILPMTALTEPGSTELAFQANENQSVPLGPESLASLSPNYDIRQTNGTDGYCRVSVTKDLLQARKFWYVRLGAPEADDEIEDNLFDVGNIICASEGNSTSGATIGRLYIKYSVEFDNVVYRPATDMETTRLLLDQGTGPTKAAPIGTSPVIAISQPVGAVPFNTSFFRLGAPGAFQLKCDALHDASTGFGSPALPTGLGVSVLTSETVASTTSNILTRIFNILWDGTPAAANDPSAAPWRNLMEGALGVANVFGVTGPNLLNTVWEFTQSILPAITGLFLYNQKLMKGANFHFYGIPNHSDSSLRPKMDGSEFTLEELSCHKNSIGDKFKARKPLSTSSLQDSDYQHL